MPSRTVAIGDVHGCKIALRTLLEAVAPGSGDEVVTLGDYIDRGPNSRGVVETLIRLAGRCRLVPLLGNHEEMLLEVHEGILPPEAWLRFGGDRALESYSVDGVSGIPQEHIDFLKSCRRFHETEQAIFVHASYYPNLSLPQQPAITLLWEHLDPQRAAPHYSGKVAIVGHTPQRDGCILDLGFLRCIDTNCCRGGWLTALDVESGRWTQADEQGRVREGVLPCRQGNGR